MNSLLQIKVTSALNYFKIRNLLVCDHYTQISVFTCSGTSCNTLLKDPHLAVSKEKQQLLLHCWISFLFSMIMPAVLVAENTRAALK